MKEIIIKKEVANQRVDKFVRKYLNDAPLSFIYKLFRKKDVKINKHWVKEDYIIQEGELLQIYVTDEQLEEFNKPKKIENIKADISIVYEDKNILIVNKPKGLLIHGDESEKRITLTNKVLSYLHQKGEYTGKVEDFVPGPVHRLDRNTSGLVIYAKNLFSSQILMNELKTHENIEKYYLALVDGEINEGGTINAPLQKNSDSGLVKVGSLKTGAKEAITKYMPLYNSNKYTLVKVQLITGRTHQIRVHFSYINHPLLGDGKYGNFEKNKVFNRLFGYNNQFLHAYELHFNNMPGELKYLSNRTFKAPLPKLEKKILSTIFNNFAEKDI